MGPRTVLTCGMEESSPFWSLESEFVSEWIVRRWLVGALAIARHAHEPGVVGRQAALEHITQPIDHQSATVEPDEPGHTRHRVALVLQEPELARSSQLLE